MPRPISRPLPQAESPTGSRIQGHAVPALFPEKGSVSVMLFGEAPGPRGADQSGIPFWGDGAGITVYRALATTGRAEVPEAAWEDWNGGRFRTLGLRPKLHGTALSNAYPACPTKDGEHFHAPSNRDLLAPANLARLSEELGRARADRSFPLQVIAFGKRAEWVLSRLPEAASFELHALPHPSAQGLLQGAPNRGKGLKLEDLREAWQARLVALLSLR
ncbi:uracil-DNA glycosylase family protein [Geothrix sp. PMB-07]|uniref:uracil-DNA glycosylase family protein n=1 Tax=Geothrix sp. PMB-07 TaxID=3068640 RepID=UPI0027429B4F|nr:uracil-DNA glycosylase family protein [Geothrix sp. PMB-07]WLT31213.1 uracil-DNA glycosylase family protein [Geothrix sp. PMB-07]